MPVFAGEIANPAQHDIDVRKGVNRGKRTTSSSTTTTETGVLRLDGVQGRAGHQLRFSTSALATDTSVNNDVARAYIRYTTDGSTATTSSTAAAFDQCRLTDAGVSEGLVVIASYTPATDEVISVLLTIARGAGSGNVSMLGDPTFPIELFVDDLGPDPGDTAVEL